MHTFVNTDEEVVMYSMTELREHLQTFMPIYINARYGTPPMTIHVMLTRLQTHFRTLTADRLPTNIRELLYSPSTDEGFIYVNGMIILEPDRVFTLIGIILDMD